ncbi:hypothetical protein [Actinokineospora sp. NPDC004072]
MHIGDAHDRRGVVALAVVAVLLTAGLVAVVISRDDPLPQPPAPSSPAPAPESPIAAAVEYDFDCDYGLIVPDEGQQVLPQEGFTPPAGTIQPSGSAVAVTVQGTGDDAVVLHSIEVEVVRRAPPPDALFLRTTCGGEVQPRLFEVDLDRPRPAVAAARGTRGFPYRIDRSEPEHLIITALTAGTAEWRLRLRWTSGSLGGELVLDDGGKPFRTAAVTGSREMCLDGMMVWRTDC